MLMYIYEYMLDHLLYLKQSTILNISENFKNIWKLHFTITVPSSVGSMNNMQVLTADVYLQYVCQFIENNANEFYQSALNEDFLSSFVCLGKKQFAVQFWKVFKSQPVFSSFYLTTA